MIAKKYKKIYTSFNYIKHLLILVCTVIGCIFNLAFAPLVAIPVGVTSSAVGIKICTATVGIKKYKSIIK